MKHYKYLITAVILFALGCGPSELDLIRADLTAGNLDQAEQACREIIEKDSTSAGGYYYLGNILQQKGDRRGALEAYKTSLKLKPSADVNVEIAGIYLRENRLQTALTFLDNAAAFRKKPEKYQLLRDEIEQLRVSAEKACKIGRKHYQDNDFKSGVKKFQQAVDINAEYKEALYYLHMSKGLVLYHSKGEDQYWDAIVEFGEAANAMSNRGEPHYLMALCYNRKDSNDFNNAIRELNKALELELEPYYKDKAEAKLSELVARKKKMDAFWGRD